MTEIINKMKPYNNGYKTLKAKDIGRHSQVGYDLIYNLDVKPSYKLIYAYLRGYMHADTQTTIMSIADLQVKTKYSTRTIQDGINCLIDVGYIVVNKRRESYDESGSYINVYSFPHEDHMFGMFSTVFLESKLLTPKEKELVILIFPYILGGDFIGSLEDPADYAWIAKRVGLHRDTVASRIRGLKQKNLMFERYARYGYGQKQVKVGFYIELKTIMIDNSNSLMQERNNFLRTVQDSGITYHLK